MSLGACSFQWEISNWGKIDDVYCEILLTKKACDWILMHAMCFLSGKGSHIHFIALNADSMIYVWHVLRVKVHFVYFPLKVNLKLDEKELEHTLQDKVLMSSILQDGLP